MIDAAQPTLHEHALVVPLGEVGLADLPIVGGKNASLGEMIGQLASKGVKVPPMPIAVLSPPLGWELSSKNSLLIWIQKILPISSSAVAKPA
jgi:hypothetical protein